MKMKTVKVSQGSAAALGLQKMKVDCFPTTVYLMTPGRCQARCLFCSQWTSQDRLSRVLWPEYPVKKVISRIVESTQGAQVQSLERVCIQCLNYPAVFEDILHFVHLLESAEVHLPISVSAQPFSPSQIAQLKCSVNRISINLDCATQKLFEKIKPFYTWEDHIANLHHASRVFGPFKVSSHIVVGLGETEEQLITMMKMLYNLQVYTSLFAFTPIKGTPLETQKKPSIMYYRRMQAAHYLIYQKEFSDFEYENGKVINLCTDIPPHAFVTRGCPGCNRPYYTETPRNPYNFPFVPGDEKMKRIKKQLEY